MSNPSQLRSAPHHVRTSRLAAAAVLATLLAAAPFQSAFAQVGPSLGSAGNFAVLSGAAVTCTGTTITGDAGSYVPGGPVVQTSCVITGAVLPGEATAVAASTDFLTAYATMAALPAAQCDAALSGTLDGVSLPPGTYCFDAAATLSGLLTLVGPADGVWIFRVGTSGAGALTGTNFSMVMAGGGNPSNVYWWVADAATMTTSDFQGTILAGAAISFTGGSLIGRDLAKAGVTLTGTSVTATSPPVLVVPPVVVDPAVVVVPPVVVDPPTPVVGTSTSLGSANSFGILSGAGVTLTGSTVTGDVGTYALNGAVTQNTSPINGSIHAGDQTAIAASNDFLAAHAAVAASPVDQCSFLTGTLAGVTLPPGNYCFDAAAVLAGVLTLDGPAGSSWLFRVGTSGAGALTGTGFFVVMSGGASACDVTWHVADAATMTTSDFQGNILSGAAITFTGGSQVGRDLAKAGVTLTGSAMTGCTP